MRLLVIIVPQDDILPVVQVNPPSVENSSLIAEQAMQGGEPPRVYVTSCNPVVEFKVSDVIVGGQQFGAAVLVVVVELVEVVVLVLVLVEVVVLLVEVVLLVVVVVAGQGASEEAIILYDGCKSTQLFGEPDIGVGPE